MWTYVRHTKKDESKGGLMVNKSEEELFCVTRQMEALKRSIRNVDEGSVEYKSLQKDIEYCENIIKDIKARFRL